METTTSATTTSTLTRRTALAALALALVAILLTGIAATPAGATTRQQGVNDANDFISRCMAGGGVPTVIMDSTGESLTVACTFDDYTIVCTYLPVNKGCSIMYGLTSQPSGSRVVNGGTLPQAQSVSSGQAVPVAQAVAIRQGTHVALSRGQLILVDDDDQP